MRKEIKHFDRMPLISICLFALDSFRHFLFFISFFLFLSPLSLSVFVCAGMCVSLFQGQFSHKLNVTLKEKKIRIEDHIYR